jgi:acetyl-CoA C-acetyltransferase
MEQRSVVVVAAKRTPMGRFLGAFSDVPAVDLGIVAARAALDAAGVDPSEVDETVAGHGRQAGNGPNPGRQVSVRAGVPETVPAYTVNKACGSSSKALTLAAGSVILDEIDVALVVGMENMTRTPYLLRGMRPRSLPRACADVVQGPLSDHQGRPDDLDYP